MKALQTSSILAGALLLGALTAAPAMATTLSWTLGNDTPSTSAFQGVASTNCNLNSSCSSTSNTPDVTNYGSANFISDSGSQPLLLSAFSTTTSTSGQWTQNGWQQVTNYYNNGPTNTQLTVKPGTGSESGVGASYNPLNNPDSEIQSNEAILVDASTLKNNGYSLTNLTIGSIQTNSSGGEGFKIYSLTSQAESNFLTTMNGIKSSSGYLPISGTLPSGGAVVDSYQNSTGCGNVAGQCTEESVNLGSTGNEYYLVTTAGLQCNPGDVILTSAGATQNQSGIPPSVPEPTSIAMLVVGLAGLGWSRSRRRARA